MIQIIFLKVINQDIIRVGDEIILEGEVNQLSNVYLLTASLDTDNYIRILPNKFENLENIEGSFSIPSNMNNRKYSLKFIFPDNYNKSSISEFLILLVTKKSFKLIEKEPSKSFYKRFFRSPKLENKKYWIYNFLGLKK